MKVNKKAIANGDIQFGDVEIDDDEFNPTNGKQRVTFMLNIDVVEKFKKLAKDKGENYRELMCEVLRNAVKEEAQED